MMKNKFAKSIIFLLASIFMFGGLAACSGQRYGTTGENTTYETNKMVTGISRWLSLDDIQKHRLIAAVDAMQAQHKAIIGAGLSPHAESTALIAGTTFDRDRAQSFLSEKLMVLQRGSPEVITAIADFYDGLKPEQQQKIRDAIQHRKTWRTFLDKK